MDSGIVLQSVRAMTCPSKKRVAMRSWSVLLLLPLTAFAHDSPGGTGPQNTHELARAWEFDLGIIIPLFVSLWLYFRGVAQLWEQTHRGCGIRRFEILCFLGGWLALVVALVSPLHP